MNIKNKELIQRLKSFKLMPDIENNDTTIFDKSTINLYRISSETAEKLSVLIENLDNISDDSEIWLTINNIINHFDSLNTTNTLPKTEKKTSIKIEQIKNSIGPGKYLTKISLNPINACNLRCTYCYANKGTYGSEQNLRMSDEDIVLTINRFAEKYDYIEIVQFMGGEPSLNPDAIEKTVHAFQNKVDQGLLKDLPKFGMVTNGVHFSKHFLEIIKKYNMSLTFSLDGPKEIHDAVRIRASGKGSFDAIIKNIKIIDDIGLKKDFEATFSKKHLEHGCSLINLCEWFYNEFGQKILHAPIMMPNRYTNEPLALTPYESMRELNAVTEWGLDNLLKYKMNMHGHTSRLLESFRTKQKNTNLCMAGKNLLSVSTKGEIYPCWMFVDEKPFYMGDIHKDDFLSIPAAAVINVLDKVELHSHPECQKCWIQPLCFGCKGADYHGSGYLDKKITCDIMRSMVETFIRKLSEVLFLVQENKIELKTTLEKELFKNKNKK